MPSSPESLPEDAPTVANGRYVVADRIGEGGMAGVYKVWDTRLRVWRAMKVLFPKFSKRRKLRTRFEAEAHTMARLEHTNLVRIYNVGDDSTLPYIVMELVTGGTLIHWTLLNGPMPAAMAVDAVLQVCEGVKVVHRGGVIHRDIKPHNVLISTEGVCKLTDFGIAQGTGDGLTKTGSSMGTLGYMAPEQRSDAKSVDGRADIYSLGATLWHLLKAEHAVDLFMCEDNPIMLNDLPVPLRPIVTRAVAYQRDNRYPDVESFMAALRQARAELDEDPPYAPGLVLDEADISQHDVDADFPEIRPVLDGFDSDFPDDDTTGEEVIGAPVGQSRDQVLPYYMPQGQAPDGKSMSERRAEVDDELPDWVDRGSLGGDKEQVTIGVDPSMVRSEDDPAPEPVSDPGPSPAAQSLEGPAPREQPPAREPAPVERPTETSEDPGYLAEPTERRVRVDETIGLDQKAPPSTPAPSGLGMAAGALTIPIAGVLIMGILVVVTTMSLLGYGSYQLYGAASSATTSRSQLYDIIRSDARNVIEQVADPGEQRTQLEDKYLTWYEAQGEPDRSNAAIAFLDGLEEVAAKRLTNAEGTQTLQEAQRTMRQLKALRTSYDRDMDAWNDQADGILGTIAITIGAGTAPPQEPQSDG